MPPNPNCDCDNCASETGEVRVLPHGGNDDMILCQACFNAEMQHHVDVNREFGLLAFLTPRWEDLEVVPDEDQIENPSL